MERAKEILTDAIRASRETGAEMRIAIQKGGRLSAVSLALLSICIEACGGTLPEKRDRLDVSPVPEFPNVEIIYARQTDIPLYIERGWADFGIMGEDKLIEQGSEAEIAARLGVCACSLNLIVDEESPITSVQDLEGKVIATSYPAILAAYLAEQNVAPMEIIEMQGGVEAPMYLGKIDATCDMVETGKSLEVNGQRVLQKVRDFEAVLIAQKIGVEKPSAPSIPFPAAVSV